MTTLKEEYLQDCPDGKWGNIKGEDGDTPHYAHLKHFLALQVRKNLPDDFREYMDFALEAVENVPCRSEDLLGYAFDICNKYFSPKSLKNKTDDIKRNNIVNAMPMFCNFLYENADNPNRSIPQRGNRAQEQSRHLAKMITDVASWYGTHKSSDAFEDRVHIFDIQKIADYCIENWAPRDAYQEKNQNDMLLALADMPKGGPNDELKDITGQLHRVYKQNHQLPNESQRELFDKIKQNTGVDGNEIFAELYLDDQKWLKQNEAFVKKCERDTNTFEDMWKTMDDVFSDKWKHQQAFHTINAIEENIRGDILKTAHFMGMLENRPDIADDDVFFSGVGGQDRVAILARDAIENTHIPELASLVMESYNKIYQNSSVRKKGLNTDDYCLVEEAARNTHKSRVQEAKERILNRRAEKEAAIKRYNDNKNKKFYTFDDLEFNMSESDNVPTAMMMFDNGWGIEVRNDLPFATDGYEACILDKSGKVTEDTALNIVEDRDENGIPDTIRRFSCDMKMLNKLMKDVQKLDKNGNLPPEYSEAENVVSGVVVADEIAKRIIKANEYRERNRKEYLTPEESKKYLGEINYEITPEVGEKLSDAIKRQYLMNKKQKG